MNVNGVYHDPRHEGSTRIVYHQEDTQRKECDPLIIHIKGIDKDGNRTVWETKAMSVITSKIKNHVLFPDSDSNNNFDPSAPPAYPYGYPYSQGMAFVADFSGKLQKESHEGHKKLLFYVTPNFIFWEDGNVWIKLFSPFETSNKMRILYDNFK